LDNNSLNNTQNAQNSQNPQDTNTPTANNGSDFQPAAPADALNEKTDNLTVQKTGEPVSAGTTSKASDSMSMAWTFGILLLLIVAGYVFYKLFKETLDEAIESEQPTKVTSQKTQVSTPKKSTSKKKSTSNKRKKTSKKRK
jgi:hypothetical protein